MYKNLSAKYYQGNNSGERYQNLSKEEKSDNMVVKVKKISQKMKK